MFLINRSLLSMFPVAAALVSFTAQAGYSQNSAYTYLALGDSVSFGLNVTLLSQIPKPSPSQFTGYPEVIANVLHLTQPNKMVNSSCPGETSGSFIIDPIDSKVPDNGCHSKGPDGELPFKSWIGLHNNYSGTQLTFATSQLAANKHINMVTLSIGANDLLLLLAGCKNAPDCVTAGVGGMLSTYGQNLAQILAQIRSTYSGTLVLLTYYSPTHPLDGLAQALNAEMAAVGKSFGATIADGYTAFQHVSNYFGGDPCQAGLLVRLSPTTCDIHPSFAGQALLAATVELSVLTKH